MKSFKNNLTNGKNNLTNGKTRRKLFFLLLIIGPLFTTSITSAQTLGYKLATIEKGYVTENDVLVKRFNSLLAQLSNNYVDSKQALSDKTVTARQLLDDNGIEESMKKIMEGMNKIYDLNNSYKKYNEYLSCYVIFRVNGYEHDKSLSLLQESINAFGINGTLEKLGIK